MAISRSLLLLVAAWAVLSVSAVAGIPVADILLPKSENVGTSLLVFKASFEGNAAAETPSGAVEPVEVDLGNRFGRIRLDSYELRGFAPTPNAHRFDQGEK